MEDIIDIIVTETTNLIEITSQPTDEIIDVNIIDNREDVTLNVTPTLVEININSLTGNFGILWGEIEGTLSNQTDLQNALNLKADLVDGKVPSSQLPSYVDDVVEVANYASLPVTGEVGKIYITLDTNYIYRWTGSVYVEIKDSSAVWGAITGTLSNQTDLQNALNAKLSTSTAASTYVPYTGATGAVNLGAYDLTVNSLRVGRGAGSIADNTVVGASALTSNTTGSSNTAIGFSTLAANTIAGGNTAIGTYALSANISGGTNTAIGYSAGSSITTGSNNVIIGGYGGTSVMTNNVVLSDGGGNIRFQYDGTNTFVGQTGNLLVGVSLNAGYKLDVNGTARISGALSGTSASFSSTISATGLSIGSAVQWNAMFYTAGASPSYIQMANGSTGAASANGMIVGIDGGGNGVINVRGSFGLTTTVAGIDRYNISSTGIHTITGAATFSSSVTASELYLSTSNGLVGNINSSNANGGYLTWQTSGAVIADIGTLQQIFGSGGSTNFGINARGARDLAFGSNNTERLRITSGGNVLIGTTTDAGYKLEVSGTARASQITSGSWVRIQTGSTNLGYFIKATDWGDTGNGNTPGIASETTLGFNIYTNGSATPKLSIAAGGAATFSSSVSGTIFYSTGATSVNSGLSIEPSGWSGAKHRFSVPVSGDTSMLSFNYNGSVVDSALYGTSAINVSSGVLYFSTGTTNTAPSERMRITSSGNVGIGNTTGPEKLSVNGNLILLSGFQIYGNSNGGSTSSYLSMYNGTDGGIDLMANYTTSKITFGTAGSERMRITSSGDLLIGTTSAIGAGISMPDGKYIWSAGTYSNTTANAANMWVGSSGVFGRSTSSLKYKTNVRDYDKGLDIIQQMRPVYYNGKNDGETLFAGLIAEEIHNLGLTEFVQYAEDGTPDALAYTHMVALLVKGIKELKIELDALKA